MRAAQVGGAGDAAGPPGFRAGSQPRHPGERKAKCCVVDPDPVSGSFLTLGSGIRIRDEKPGSYLRELRNNFYGLKLLNSLMRIRDLRSGINLPDPQH